MHTKCIKYQAHRAITWLHFKPPRVPKISAIICFLCFHLKLHFKTEGDLQGKDIRARSELSPEPVSSALSVP